MNGALRITILAALGLLIFLSGGCATTISEEEFLSRYMTNIAVPNPESHRLPCRKFLGQRKGYYRLKDYIPAGQGGMFLIGSRTTWRCPAEELPADFPVAYRPGDCMIDGQSGRKYTYVIQSYWDSAGSGATTNPASAP